MSVQFLKSLFVLFQCLFDSELGDKKEHQEGIKLLIIKAVCDKAHDTTLAHRNKEQNL